MTLNIMVLESEPGAADQAVRDLAEAGHSVLRCHDPGAPVFPCRGLVDESTCPLRSHAIDVALTVRSGVSLQPAASEDGARCALMRHVPLVVAGPSVFDPYADLEVRVVEPAGDIVAACEEAAENEMAEYAQRAESVVKSAAATVTVVRKDGGLCVTIAGLGACTEHERRAAVVRAFGALRGIDRSARTIDVSLAGS